MSGFYLAKTSTALARHYHSAADQCGVSAADFYRFVRRHLIARSFRTGAA